MKPHNLVGQRFGRLTVIERYPVPNISTWTCQCDCGNITHPRARSLINGITQSCGCLRTERIKLAVTKHGKHNTPLYKVWTAIKMRCLNPNCPAWDLYGGRGITICDEWLDFETFAKAVGERPSNKHSLDRYPDPNGNYEPGNVRWATQFEQMQNMSRNVHVTWNGETHTLSEWSRRTGISESGLGWRYHQGWPPEKMFSQERQKGGIAPQMFTLGEVTQSLPDWAKATGIPYGTIKTRLRKGWSLEQALRVRDARVEYEGTHPQSSEARAARKIS